MSNRSCFSCGVECVRIKCVGRVGARRTMTTAKEPRGGMLFCEGLCKKSGEVVAVSEANNRSGLQYVVTTMG